MPYNKVFTGLLYFLKIHNLGIRITVLTFKNIRPQKVRALATQVVLQPLSESRFI